MTPTCSLREPSAKWHHPWQEQTRTLLPSTNRSYTPVDSQQSHCIDICDMHKLLFVVVHLPLDKASCYILDKNEETPLHRRHVNIAELHQEILFQTI